MCIYYLCNCMYKNIIYNYCNCNYQQNYLYTCAYYTPTLVLALINSILIRIEYTRHNHSLLHTSLYSINLILHSLLLICIVAIAVINYSCLACIMHIRMTISYHQLLISIVVLILLSSYLLLYLNIYWLIYPTITYSAFNHISIQLLLLSICAINLHSLLHVLVILSSLTHLHACDPYTFIYHVLLVLYVISHSILLSLCSAILYESAQSLSIYLYQYIAYIHTIWIYGHIEVYIVLIPTIILLMSFLQLCLHYPLYEYHTLIISFINIAILSSITWVHHIYTVTIYYDIVNYYTSVSICISLSTINKCIMAYSSMTRAHLFHVHTQLVHLYHIVTVLGGLSGLLITIYSVNAAIHHTSLIYTHCHCILSLSLSIAVLLLWSIMYHPTYVYLHLCILVLSTSSIAVRRIYTVTPTSLNTLITYLLL